MLTSYLCRNPEAQDLLCGFRKRLLRERVTHPDVLHDMGILRISSVVKPYDCWKRQCSSSNLRELMQKKKKIQTANKHAKISSTSIVIKLELYQFKKLLRLLNRWEEALLCAAGKYSDRHTSSLYFFKLNSP